MDAGCRMILAGVGHGSIRRDVLKDLGEMHHGRKRIQPPGRVIREFYDDARTRLRFPVLSFDDRQIALIAEAFDDVIRQHYTCYAAAIMSDHVHLLIRKHRDKSEQMIARFQAASRLRLIDRRATSIQSIACGSKEAGACIWRPRDVRSDDQVYRAESAGSAALAFCQRVRQLAFSQADARAVEVALLLARR